MNVEAAEQVCSADQLPVESVLDALAGLVDKSVLIAERGVDPVRYGLPEPLSEYGRVKLADTGDEGWMRQRHCGYYGQHAKGAWQEWFGPRQLQWATWMRHEHVNLRAALEFGLAESGRKPDLFVVPALGIHWTTSGSLEEGRRFTNRAVDLERGKRRPSSPVLHLGPARTRSG